MKNTISSEMKTDSFKILLGDDDEDDCMFFRDALEELSFPASLNIVNNGVELMSFLESNSINLPHVLFLDLNMPLKAGSECLLEIKQNEKLKKLPVVIFSTSANPEVMESLYKKGAQHYIKKPSDFENLKSVIHKALIFIGENKFVQPPKENFLILP